ncbi:ELWxxDGT repeat protein [Paraflavitalea sp. CAU 1676]|uniref:ELWxxDGT repeat protein n=1 Tax=Paraflavitalea sp. CAU 1676 TaxID=3032598 RepID=UPI0023DCA3CA|nr:ELWxxDGT repeat protein [Paraflavitalea sp. CAU 1676]MDF2187904.1 T9SS type A sorting domain-containing protein [Paraflavitalea sp. CAU 1676]
MRNSTLLLLLVFLIVTAQESFAQVFSLLKDINEVKPASSALGSNPKGMLEINGVTYFTATMKTTGTELWKTDGTAAGTMLVRDIFPGIPTSVPSHFVNKDGVLYFQANDGVHGAELWKSDGTAAGTVMVKDIFPGPGDGKAAYITNVNGTLYFAASNGTNGAELWKSDGTAAGTVMVKDILPEGASSAPQFLINVKGTLYFGASTTGYDTELWKSDGTAPGTVMMKENSLYRILNPRSLINVSGTLYCVSATTSGQGIYKTDGTAAGAMLVKYFFFPETINIVNVNGVLFFAGTDAVNGTELWKSDGTMAGTVLVKDIRPGIGDGALTSLTAVNNTLYFYADDGTNGPELWKSDGTGGGTQMVKDIVAGAAGSAPSNLVNTNGTLLFCATTSAGRELWKSDGTAAGTVMVKDCNPGSGHGMTVGNEYVGTLKNQLLFTADNGIDGAELWMSNGTEAGTAMVKNLNPLASVSGFESYTGLYPLNGVMYFVGDDGIHGTELWKSDGTAAGTKMVKDINSGANGSGPSSIVIWNGFLYFAAYDVVNGQELWKSDGTEAGTVLVKDIYPGLSGSFPGSITVMGNAIYFNATNGNTANGTELWKSDGTATGTVMVKDIYPGTNSGSPGYLTVINNTLYFAATDANGKELWKSNGTAAGTVMVKDIYPGGSSSPKYLANVNNRLYFNATTAAAGSELWSSDGTAAGTNMQVDLCPGTCSGDPRYIIELFSFPFYVGYHPSQGYEFRTITSFENGILRDINPGAAGSDPEDFIKIGNTIYFTAEDGANGRGLWKHDAVTGISLVKNIAPNLTGGPSALFDIQGRVFFAGSGGAAGPEPWRSDGTEAGTIMLQDVTANGGSDPVSFAEANGKLFSIMTDEAHGTELWVADLMAALPVSLLEFNGRLVQDDALLHWKTTGEVGTHSFEIERSTDGRSYSTVGSVAAANSPGIHTYAYDDRHINLPGVTKLYYRLKQIDIDGRFTYSGIVMLSLTNTQPTVLLYPNPVVNELRVTISVNRPEKIQARVVDNVGKTLMLQQWNSDAGATLRSLDMSKLPKGVYFLELKGETINEVRKVVK